MSIGVGFRRGNGWAPKHPLPDFEDYIPSIELPVDDDTFPYARLIDPFDETIFTSHQCRVLEGEFERLASTRPSPTTERVLELVRKCARESDAQLWFVGD